MQHHVKLNIASLLSILFFTFHHADDVRRGRAPGSLANLVPVLISVVWLYGTLVLGGRRAGYIITLLLSLLVSAIPIIHMLGTGLVGGDIDKSSGVFFWIWTLIALGITSIFSVILSAQGLWRLQRGQSLASDNPKVESSVPPRK